MATPKFDALVSKVRNWTNRDADILTDALITDFLDYSADFCYRNLRIPPLEYVYKYATITSGSEGETSLQLPPDFTELITFSKTDADGKVYTFNKKLAGNQFKDSLTKVPENSFTYKGNLIQFHPAAKVGEVYELHYYRRLPDLDAVYVDNAANQSAGIVGDEVYNWLRDDNERLLLWGALGQAFDFLHEEEKANRYYEKQRAGIQELNNEEKQRKAKGASNIVTFEVTEIL